METSRSEYVFKNVFVTLTMQIIKNILAFVSRTVFVYVLGAEYLGVNSLFTDILTVLSFTELGIGNAMIFSLYKPLAENNIEKMKSLMKLYSRAYQAIGVIIAILGVCIVPFLRYIVGDVSYIKENIIVLYLLFLLNSVISYFFVYKKSLIIADQKNYIVDIYQQIFYAIQVIIQSIFLVVTKQFIAYLIIMVVITFLNNFYVAHKANKMFPFLTEKNVQPLSKKEVSGIVTNVKALVIYKVGGIILESTDSIFISSLINVVTVGLYANYKMIVNVFKTIGNQVMNSVVASIGNLNASANAEKKEKVFYEIFYVNTWFYGFTTVGLCVFMTPFIKIWLGNLFEISFASILAICVYFYVSNMHYPCYTYRTTAGLFVFGKYVPLIAAIINIVLDVFMGKYLGLPGILWASTISRVFTYEIVDPIMVYKRIFHKPVMTYFLVYFATMILVVVDGLISAKVISFIKLNTFIGLILQVIVFSLVFNIIFFIVTCWTAQFKSIYERMKTILCKKRKK